MRTFSVTFDIVALNTVMSPITVEDSLVYGFMSQWVSFAATFLVVAFLSLRHTIDGKPRAIGYKVDPDFGRMSILPKEPMKYQLLAGVFAGISTLSYYVIAGQSDASAVLPFGQLVIVYLLFADLMAEKDTPTIIEIQCITSILLGVLLVGVSPGGFDPIALLIVLVPLNLASAFFTYFQKKTKRYAIRPGLRVDSLNMRLWSLLFLNITFSLPAALMITPTGWAEMVQTFVPLLWMMVGSSLTAFFSLVMYVRALGRGSMAVVNSLSSISVVLGIPVTLIGNFFLPGGFGSITSDTFLWTLKVFGVILVMIGVFALQGSDVRSIMLLRVKPQTGDLLPLLYEIKGVESASALAGGIDYLLSVKSRSLAKTRTQILKRVQRVPGVASIHTLIVLREYR
ncbi:MAG: hypothetical protein C4K49_03635 [Candidatus Thorarchaeota archaeon]|nr:MAG: hypothetical protein C4K49_03635 [Candidatus Thorarchaeota archaeon]